MKKCLLIDEAQICYKDEFLWNGIKDIADTGTGLIIVLAASYGSATVKPAELTFGVAPSLKPRQRLSLRPVESEPACLYLDWTETQDVIMRDRLEDTIC